MSSLECFLLGNHNVLCLHYASRLVHQKGEQCTSILQILVFCHSKYKVKCILRSHQDHDLSGQRILIAHISPSPVSHPVTVVRLTIAIGVSLLTTGPGSGGAARADVQGLVQENVTV